LENTSTLINQSLIVDVQGKRVHHSKGDVKKINYHQIKSVQLFRESAGFEISFYFLCSIILRVCLKVLITSLKVIPYH